MSKNILLIGFYNEKALGVRYLAKELEKNGYYPYILFFKRFNSIRPRKASKKELDILEELIKDINPSYIGLSVMSSLYLESVFLVNNMIRDKFEKPIIWGGVYPTLFPERALEHCDYVVRGEGEKALVELLNRLEKNQRVSDMKNIAIKDENNKIIINEVRPLVQKLDELEYPDLRNGNKYMIYNDTLVNGDPQINSLTYELTASRGCPFACSYCSSINLKRIYSKKGKYVRFRSVDSVMKELNEAKRNIRNLKVIHFWDEIFSDEPGWIEEFRERYKKEIGLPFKIWGHPLKINERVISNLVEAGLYQIVVGIQSGSVRVRKNVFNRTESQQDIVNSSRILSKCKVPKVIYDFMLQHPFETSEDLLETFRLCLKLEPPFELQIHGLNFLPGTDIVDAAIKEGLLTKDELEKIMYSTIQEQYDMYWGPAAVNKISEENVWISLIYLTQFPTLRALVEVLAKKVERGNVQSVVMLLQKIMKKTKRVKNIIEKGKIVMGG